MLNLEIDGRKVEVAPGSTVMDAAKALDIYVPHFCYHKKLSIAANCRMCLVQVEKAPKPLPACATPAAEGMKVWTQSEQAKKAQQGVMEFLLINHPLDCRSATRAASVSCRTLASATAVGVALHEPKRVVFHKNSGRSSRRGDDALHPVHALRALRPGDRRRMELGMIGRGEHAEIVVVRRPTRRVGALRQHDRHVPGRRADVEAFRLRRAHVGAVAAPSVSPHDSLGSNLIVQVKSDRVLRVVRSRIRRSTNAGSRTRTASRTRARKRERLTAPMIKDGGEWKTVDWPTALDFVAPRLKSSSTSTAARARHARFAALDARGDGARARLTRALGSDNIDFRLRQRTSAATARRAASRGSGMPIADLETRERVLVIGSFLRKDHPLARTASAPAARKGARDLAAALGRRRFAHQLKHSLRRACRRCCRRPLAEIVSPRRKGRASRAPALAGIEPVAAAEVIAASLSPASDKAILLGNLRGAASEASQLFALAQALADIVGAKLGCLSEAANSVGGYAADALAADGRRAERESMSPTAQGVSVLGVEPEFDCANPVARAPRSTRRNSSSCMSPFRHGWNMPTRSCRSVRSPRPPARSSTAKGRPQPFNGVVQPFGETPSRVESAARAGIDARLAGFDLESIDDVRTCCPRRATSQANLPTHARRDREARRSPTGSSASPTCRSISPIRSCGARRRCSRRRTRSRRKRG
jgi:NADH-quinone oxidoreductase subunit G